MIRPDSDGEAIIGRLGDIFDRRGAEAYLGEAVTMAEHMLQCAALAQAEGAAPMLVVAALLHDIGHFTGEFTYSPQDTVDHRHEIQGAAMLERFFPPLISESVRLHVAAKRYLCATDPGYYDRLSSASKHSLSLQGGPMDAAETEAFQGLEFHREAIAVRLWDDGAKMLDVSTPTFSDFEPLLRSTLR